MSDKLKNLIVRTISGVVLFAIVLGAVFVGAWGYAALLMLIATVGVWEFYNLARAKGVEPQRVLGLIGTMGFTLAGTGVIGVTYDYYGWEPAILFGFFIAALAIMFVFVAEVFRNRQNPIHNIATTIMGMIYLGIPMCLMAFIPMLLQRSDFRNPEWDAWYILFYLFLVWGNDVFAYLVGVSIGKHRMCERLSPKKSWEGFVGGVIGSLAMGALGAWTLNDSYALWLGLAFVVSISSVLGDLVESMFKRDAGVKDSGKIMPGHGGMLDRFDALIASAPFAFIYLLLFCTLILT